ncbi:uncharacterized protein Z519_09169 [Cladophialophora bantiana CBS 173.52]|uniref:Nucleolar complex-associated protein 3 n=1 Tax=Cladophialophora bantiana (strain ATCC 10958 / CBS 173.52 / CDC B-1940 / NIH 8579) TaxID=1442370 RepID=A0A0D2FVH3_CLAB1|nr:uncharacterized protein Z519_09169 [Cladophialophora bantiana CBS 173.52]KIW90522.1 hypothetical protein Z519_09169 [Cladophialophora bantiana CBS 173.52]
MPHGRPTKRRRLSPLIDDCKVSETIKASDLFVRAADWDLEQEYEKKSRQKKNKESTRLPIKTPQGKTQRVEEKAPTENEDDSDSFMGSGTDDEDDEKDETPPTETEPAVPQVPLKQQIVAAKEEIARIVSLLNEDPEEHAGSFKKLAQVSGSTSAIVVQKLVLAAQAAVYKDVIPGYRIRSYKDDELGNKISKDVRQTRQYEHALVTGYQAYLKQLSGLAKGRKGDADTLSLRSVAINCACTLLLSVPHFNFRTELLNILVHEVSSREPSPGFLKCVETLEQFFSRDEDGAPSLEAVSLLTKMMKAKDYRVREEVLNTFFHLRLLSELAPPGSTGKPDRPEQTGKVHGRKVKQQASQHLSKRERKLLKQRREVEKDMAEASALVNHEEREKMQSETLKLVFVTYFRVLKARIPELMGAVLEGLAKYAHLINQDFFGDVLEALKEIVGVADEAVRGELDVEGGVEEESKATNLDAETIRNRKRESLLATQTAFTLLSGQDVSKAASSLHLDLSFFTGHIYRSLYPLSLDADIELGPKSLHLADPHSSKAPSSNAANNRINISTPILLLTRVLTSILLSPSSPPPTQTVLSFFKRLLTVSLQLPEKSTLAVFNLMAKIADKHGRKIEALWYSDERKGDGVYRGDSESVEGTNVLGTGSGVWELELLKRHYCPKTRESAQTVEGIIRDMHR